jgi:hypothetical protein
MISVPLLLKLAYHHPDRSVDKFNFLEKRRAGRPDLISVTTVLTVNRRQAAMLIDQLLTHAHRLEVHPENVGHARVGGAVMIHPVDLV